MDDGPSGLTYRRFIDEMVLLARHSVSADRIAAHGHSERTNDAASPLRAGEIGKKQLCLGLLPDEKVTLAQLLLDERQAAIHDVLAYLEWAVSTEKMSVSAGDGPFLGKADVTMHADFISRSDDHEWQGV